MGQHRRRASGSARSWIAEYHATDGGTMLGGVRSSRSSRWQKRADAERYLAAAIENNASAGRKVAGTVVPSSLHPEIFYHCPGDYPQAIGGHCFECKKKLTVADARDA